MDKPSVEAAALVVHYNRAALTNELLECRASVAAGAWPGLGPVDGTEQNNCAGRCNGKRR